MPEWFVCFFDDWSCFLCGFTKHKQLSHSKHKSNHSHAFFFLLEHLEQYFSSLIQNSFHFRQTLVFVVLSFSSLEFPFIMKKKQKILRTCQRLFYLVELWFKISEKSVSSIHWIRIIFMLNIAFVEYHDHELSLSFELKIFQSQELKSWRYFWVKIWRLKSLLLKFPDDLKEILQEYWDKLYSGESVKWDLEYEVAKGEWEVLSNAKFCGKINLCIQYSVSSLF